MRRTLAAASVLLSLLSCGPGEPEGSVAEESSPPNPVEGLITAIEGTSLELRAEDGRSYRFEIADPTVPVRHLRDELPVLITWQTEGGGLVATTIADAPA
jgi:hypothetical protein